MKLSKQILLLILGYWLLAIGAMAQVQPGDNPYSLSLHVGYGHNLT